MCLLTFARVLQKCSANAACDTACDCSCLVPAAIDGDVLAVMTVMDTPTVVSAFSQWVLPSRTADFIQPYCTDSGSIDIGNSYTGTPVSVKLHSESDNLVHTKDRHSPRQLTCPSCRHIALIITSHFISRFHVFIIFRLIFTINCYLLFVFYRGSISLIMPSLFYRIFNIIVRH